MAERTCSFPGCDRPHYGRGWCKKHHRRWQRTGDPAKTRPRPPATRRPIAERFWPKVNKNGPIPEHRPDLGPCWIWTACKDKHGYGRIGRGGQGQGTIAAYRVAYELLVGPIPKGLEPDHLCRVTSCVKATANEQGPSHLEAVTRRVNSLRGSSPLAQKAAQTHCKRGHEFTAENTYRPPSRPTSRVCRQCSAEKEARRPPRSRKQRAA